jgi:hypothetical protein
VRAVEIVHLDETPWYQGGVLRWLWVAASAATTVYRIDSRRKEELSALIGEVFLGWLASDATPPTAIIPAASAVWPIWSAKAGARRGQLRRRLRLRLRPHARPAAPHRAGPRRRGDAQAV